MKKKCDDASTKSTTQVHTPLSVEVRIREQFLDNEAAAQSGAQGWAGRVLVLVVVLAIAGIYVGVHISRGWIPSDDGILSQSALRVMQGQLPHLDFEEVYTGGLSFIHALAFRVFGVNLMSLRICVFLLFLAWLPAVYSIALRFVSPISAGVVTLLAVAWSYPNYPAAMPSWYNLFFATFGAAALLRYLDVRTRRWLFIAGVCGGVSVLIKVIGAYYIAGALLFFSFVEQSEEQSEAQCATVEVERSTSVCLYRMFNVVSLLLFLVTVLSVLRAQLDWPELYHFVLPSAAIVGLILLGERGAHGRSGRRFRAIFRLGFPFVGGLVIPIVVFLIPYARSGAVSRFVFGVTGSAVERAVSLAMIRPQGVEKVIYVLPLMGVLMAAMYWGRFQGKAVGVTLGLGAVALAVMATRSNDFVYGIWCSVAMLTPVVVLAGAVLVWLRRKPDAQTRLRRQQIVLLISLAGTCSLVQFPLAAAMYLNYTAPLTLLALVAIVSVGKTQSGTYALASVLGLYLAFGVVTLIPLSVFQLALTGGPMHTMLSSRAGGLKIEQAELFDAVAGFLRDHSPNGLMYAGNDCPELYFLSGLKNVVRDDAGAPVDAVLKALQSDDLKLAVINEAPLFSGSRMNPQVRAEVVRKFPHSSEIGPFHVYWKD